MRTSSTQALTHLYIGTLPGKVLTNELMSEIKENKSSFYMLPYNNTVFPYNLHLAVILMYCVTME